MAKEEATQPVALPEKKKASRFAAIKGIFSRKKGEKKAPKEKVAKPLPPTPAASQKGVATPQVGWAKRIPRFPSRPTRPPIPPQVVQRKSAQVSASTFFSQEEAGPPVVPSRRVDIGTLILDILIGILVLVAIAIVVMWFLRVKLPLPF